MKFRPSGRIVLLDTCAVINFAAGGHFEDLARFHGNFRVVDVVASEAIYIRRGGMGDDASDRLPIDLQPLASAGLLVVETASGEDELDTFIDFTLELDDGEAMTLAIAIHRNYVVATDDRKAIRLAAGRVEIRSTLEIIKQWTDHAQIPEDRVRQLLLDLRDRGRYIPRRSHPLRSWWEHFITST